MIQILRHPAHRFEKAGFAQLLELLHGVQKIIVYPCRFSPCFIYSGTDHADRSVLITRKQLRYFIDIKL